MSDVGVEKGTEDLIERREIVEVPMYVVTLTGGVQCACAHPCTVPSISGSRDTLMGGGSVSIHVLSWNGQSISGSRDTLTGGCSVHAPIHVLSHDGQSISRSRDTPTMKVQCACACPCTVPGWSEYLRISEFSDWGGRGQCAYTHPCTILG